MADPIDTETKAQSDTTNPIPPPGENPPAGDIVAHPNPTAENTSAPASTDAPASEGDAPDLTTVEQRQAGVFRDIALVLVCSGFLMAVSARECDSNDGCTDNMGWGVACGILGAVATAPWLIIMRFGPGRKNPEKYSGTILRVLVVFLLCLYIGGAGVLTFDGPFEATGNGYFLSWGGFVFSCHAVYLTFDFIQNWFHAAMKQAELMTIEKRMIAGLIGSTCIEMIESAVKCGKDDCTDKVGFGVAMGAIGFVYALVLMFFYAKLVNLMPYLAFGSSVLWGITAVVLTFRGGPYYITGNGYFSAWAAFVFSFALTFLTARHIVNAKMAELDKKIDGPKETPTGTAEPAPTFQGSSDEPGIQAHDQSSQDGQVPSDNADRV